MMVREEIQFISRTGMNFLPEKKTFMLKTGRLLFQMKEDSSEWLATCAPRTFPFVVYRNGAWLSMSSVRERVSYALMSHPDNHLLIQSGNLAMSSTFAIYNMATKQITVTAPTPELIEREYNHTDAYFPKRGMMQQIAEFPSVLGLSIHTYKMFPESMIMDGITRYAQRKAGR